MRARGFGIVELVLVVAIIGGLVGAYLVIDGRGYARGAAETRDKAVQAQLSKDRAVSVALLLNDKARVAAEQAAQSYKTQWEEARRAAQRSGSALGSCDQDQGEPAQDVAQGGGGAAGNAGAGLRQDGDGAAHRTAAVRLLWRFVGLHDLAFLGRDGKPLFNDSAAYALDAARTDTASPYTLGDAIDVHGRNADALNVCRKAYFNARGDLEVAAAAWDREQGR